VIDMATTTPLSPGPARPVGLEAVENEAAFTDVRQRRLPPAGLVFGVGWIVALTFMAFFADYLPFIRDYTTKVRVDGRIANGRRALGPGWTAWFGTDQSGFDVFAKCIYGARVTLIVGVGATIIGLFFGTLLGVWSGYFKGFWDRSISVITDCLLALPALVIASVLVYRLDDLKARYSWLGWATRVWQITLVLGLVAIAPLARIVRAQTLSLSQREFVLAARSVGAGNRRIIFREIMPNLVPAMVTVAFTGLALLIAAEGGLAFLGFSVETPTPTWGKLIALNYNRLDTQWWATIFPSLMLFFTVLAFNLIGDHLARRFDIREATL
jgi:peptide/nickel transport system permease protein